MRIVNIPARKSATQSNWSLPDADRRACGTHRCGSGLRAVMCRPIGASAGLATLVRPRRLVTPAGQPTQSSSCPSSPWEGPWDERLWCSTERVFNLDRKGTHWGKRLARDR
jgi:hypothetical protein